MNKNVESSILEGCRRRVAVEVEPATVKDYWAREVKEVKNKANLPGFRPGRVPEEVVTRQFREEIDRGAIEKILSLSCRQALEKTGLDPVTEPRIENVSFVRETGREEMSYELVFDVAPEVSLEDYRDISLSGDSAEVADREVEETLGKVLDANPGLRQEALELKARERMKNNIRARLEAERRHEIESRQDEMIVEQLLERASLDVPQGLVEKRAAELAGREIQRTMPGFPRLSEEERKKTAQETVEKFRTQAEKEIKASFVLEEVAGREKVAVSEEEISGRVDLLARLAQKSREEVESELGESGRNDLRNRLRIEKTFDLLRKRCLLLEKPRIVRA